MQKAGDPMPLSCCARFPSNCATLYHNLTKVFFLISIFSPEAAVLPDSLQQKNAANHADAGRVAGGHAGFFSLLYTIISVVDLAVQDL